MPTKNQLLTDIHLQIQACTKCPYGKVRQNPLLGNGEHRSPILVIGRGARQRDDSEKTVFSGRAEKKLDRMLNGAELSIDKVYRTYTIRCYPGRQPSFGEFAAYRRCSPYTTKMMKALRPIAVVICGYKVFKWMLLRYTSEVVPEQLFYKWIGRAVRLKEVWGDIKFFVIECPAELSRSRNPEAEAKSIEVLTQMKAYVKAKQNKEPMALEMTDLKRRPRTKDGQQTFGWS